MRLDLKVMDEEVSPSKEGQTQHQELAEEAKLSPATSPWHPRQLVFSLYSPPHETGGKNINPLRVVVRKPVRVLLPFLSLVESYKKFQSQKCLHKIIYVGKNNYRDIILHVMECL